MYKFYNKKRQKTLNNNSAMIDAIVLVFPILTVLFKLKKI